MAMDSQPVSAYNLLTFLQIASRAVVSTVFRVLLDSMYSIGVRLVRGGLGIARARADEFEAEVEEEVEDEVEEGDEEAEEGEEG